MALRSLIPALTAALALLGLGEALAAFKAARQAVATESGQCTVEIPEQGSLRCVGSGCHDAPTCSCELAVPPRQSGCTDNPELNCGMPGCCKCCLSLCTLDDGARDEACCKEHPMCCP
mmetsp:Transcript_61749/g.199040  ORF Transcript_61749/g.199040 Transcript_61749/m.199040 type:complete len:118 (-) Transcript_61749:169-522(-)